MIETTLNLSFLVSMTMIVWFLTDAFVEYTKLFRMGWLVWIPLYEQQKEDDPTLTYVQFLRINFHSFFVRLITCPVCVSTWLSIILSLVFGVVYWFPTIMMLSLILYYAYKNLSK
jgi:hypothetical protein